MDKNGVKLIASVWCSIILALSVSPFILSIVIEELQDGQTTIPLKNEVVDANFSGIGYITDLAKKNHDDLIIEKLDQRVYQFYRTKEYGYILRYRIHSVDSQHPISYTYKVKRSDDGKVLTYSNLIRCFKVSTNNDDWEVVRIDGLYTEHWKPDGSIQCVSFADGNSIHAGYWGDGVLSLEVRPSDGYYSTGAAMDGTPLHSIEVEVFVHPKK